MVKRVSYWLYAFICTHVLLWTLAPTIVRYTLPLDAMEGSTWGHQFEWGYDKNPFMNGWLTAIAVKIGGTSGWMVYFFSQLSVALCFWAIWQLGKKMLPPIYALIAVLLLEGIQYYNFHAIDFNDNTLELGFWALTILFFYQAIRHKKLSDWLCTGVFAGLSMMTKYYTVVLLFPMFLFVLYDKHARTAFKETPMYIGLLVFLAIITPHVFWLFQHDFITVNYALNRVSSPPTWGAHLFFPAQFSWQMFEAFLPAGLLFSILIYERFVTDPVTRENILKINHDIIDHEEKVTYIRRSDRAFLLFVGLGPFLITVLLAAISGIKLRAGWGQPLLSLWGLILLAYTRPAITPKQFYRFIATLFFILGIAVAGYCIALIRADRPSSANYPGEQIASTLTRAWHKKYHTPVSYVAGSRWLAGNVSFYSKDSPTVYIDWNPKVSSWIDEKKLKETGAIFVWDLAETDDVPYKAVKKRFPKTTSQQLVRFHWLRNPTMTPVAIKVAFLPPEKKTK